MEMTAKERFSAFINRKPMDRLPVIEWAPWWTETVDAWHASGVPDIVGDDLQAYFGLDRIRNYGMSALRPGAPRPASFNAGVLAPEAAYEDLLPFLYPDPEEQFPAALADELRTLQAKGDSYFRFDVNGFFWFPRSILGVERHFLSFYDEDAFLQRLCSDYLKWLHRVFEVVGNRFTFDFMTFGEDMSYNKGPMISEETFNSFLYPFYADIIPQIHECGMPVVIDSDGDITQAVDWYARAGVNGMLPLERQAGVDVSLYLQKQPDMFFIGHFDKMCMKFGPAAMEAEFGRLLPSMRTGRLIPSVDHQTPPDVTPENYRAYTALLRKYAALAV